jgi:hypothetical protein
MALKGLWQVCFTAIDRGDADCYDGDCMCIQKPYVGLHRFKECRDVQSDKDWSEFLCFIPLPICCRQVAVCQSSFPAALEVRIYRACKNNPWLSQLYRTQFSLDPLVKGDLERILDSQTGRQRATVCGTLVFKFYSLRMLNDT